MTPDTMKNAVRTSAVATSLGTIAGFAAGPLWGAAVGFITGCPVWIWIAAAIGAAIWVNPVIAIWLGATAACTTGGFLLGTLRKPPPKFQQAFYAPAATGPDAQRIITTLQRKLAAERQRADQAETLVRYLSGTLTPVTSPPHSELTS